MSYIQYIDPPGIHYIFPSRGSNKLYWLVKLKRMLIIEYLWDRYKKEKYYKGTDSMLYFPYVPDSKHLKEVPHVTIPYYWGLKANKVIFDDVLDLLFKERNKK